jgi:hypothetical protein
LLIL